MLAFRPEAVEVVESRVIDVVFSVLNLGISPRASIASRAAFSFAFLALSSTSSCNNHSQKHMHF